jgi:hypothetical protein
VLFELGLVGAAAFLAAALLAARQAIVAGLRWAREGPWAELGYVPAAWLAGLAGTIAGAALFGGAPIAAMFWLILGVAAAAPALAPAPAG